jgi:hypothetical protein
LSAAGHRFGMKRTSVVSPGGWQVPAGRRPGWEWVPPTGASARLDRMPRWVRILYWTPWVDRYAHVWMWSHGGWDVEPPDDLGPAAAAALVWSGPAPQPRAQGPASRAWSRVAGFVWRLFDPAERYMRRGPAGRRRPRPTRWSGGSRRPSREVAHGSAVREPDADEVAWMRAEAERHQAALRDAERRWGHEARICADELVRGASTVLSFDGGQVRGRLVRFWRGDSVLELESVGSNGEGIGGKRTRLSRRPDTDNETIAFCLLDQVTRVERQRPTNGR